jgi:hypothetical protein
LTGFGVLKTFNLDFGHSMRSVVAIPVHVAAAKAGRAAVAIAAAVAALE